MNSLAVFCSWQEIRLRAQLAKPYIPRPVIEPDLTVTVRVQPSGAIGVNRTDCLSPHQQKGKGNPKPGPCVQCRVRTRERGTTRCAWCRQHNTKQHFMAKSARNFGIYQARLFAEMGE